MFDRDSDITARLVVDLIEQLPIESRFAKYMSNDALDTTENILVSLLDGIHRLEYQTSIAAAAQAGKEYKGLQKNAPKPLKRPKVREEDREKKPRKFIKTADLIAGIDMLNHESRKLTNGG